MFEKVKCAIEMHTGYTLRRDVDDDGYDIFLLIDPSGDIDGEPFEDIADVVDYVSYNDYVYNELALL